MLYYFHLPIVYVDNKKVIFNVGLPRAITFSISQRFSRLFLGSFTSFCQSFLLSLKKQVRIHIYRLFARADGLYYVAELSAPAGALSGIRPGRFRAYSGKPADIPGIFVLLSNPAIFWVFPDRME